jgi:hypothetical protein
MAGRVYLAENVERAASRGAEIRRRPKIQKIRTAEGCYLTFGNSTFKLLQSSMFTPEQPFAHSG